MSAVQTVYATQPAIRRRRLTIHHLPRPTELPEQIKRVAFPPLSRRRPIPAFITILGG